MKTKIVFLSPYAAITASAGLLALYASLPMPRQRCTGSGTTGLDRRRTVNQHDVPIYRPASVR